MIRRAAALVTGASSGIGAAFARRLAAEGYDLVIHGRREHLLKELCTALRAKGVEATYVLAELSDPSDLARLEARVRSMENLEILVNNAGFGARQAFQETDIDLTEEMIRVHAIAPVRLAYAALPAMRLRKKGTIINVSSVAAFFLSAQSNTYCSTKAFLNSFSESLALEVRDEGISVQALCPGFTTTDFHRRAGIEPPKGFGMKFVPPEEVVDCSFRALGRRRKVICIPGFKYRFAASTARLLPRGLLYRLVGRFQGGRAPADEM